MPDGIDWGAAVGSAIDAGFRGYNNERDRKFTERKLDQEAQLERLKEEVRLMIAELEEGGRNQRFGVEEGGRNTRHGAELTVRREEEGGRNSRHGQDIVSREWVSGLDRDQRDSASRRSYDASMFGHNKDFEAAMAGIDQRDRQHGDQLDFDVWRTSVGDTTNRRGQDVSSATTRRGQDMALRGRVLGSGGDPYSTDNAGAVTMDPWTFDGSAYAPPERPAFSLRTADLATYSQKIAAAQARGDFAEVRRLTREARQRIVAGAR